MTKKLTTFDPAEGLTSDEAVAAFMAEAFASQDAGYIAHAVCVVARAGLRLLEEHETKLANLRAALIEGEESGPSEPFDFDSFIKRKRVPMPE